jgi:hypothetical protein
LIQAGLVQVTGTDAPPGDLQAMTNTRSDRIKLLEHAFITAILITTWFGIASLSHDVLIQSLLGWSGFVLVALYWGWLLRKHHLRRPKM